MNKRNFLKFTAALGLLSNINILFAQNKENINLLVIFLRGGADGLNMLVPYNDESYYEARPNIATHKNDCFKINETFGLNKTLSVLKDLYLDKQLAFIPACGQKNNSRSHFQAQDVMEFGINDVTVYDSGFLARLAELNKISKPISFTENLPHILRHKEIIVPTLAQPHLSGLFNLNENNNFKFNDMKLSDTYKKVNENIKIIEDFKKINSNNEFKNTKLYNVAKFMNESGYNIAFADFDDWDTHANQNIRMNALMKNLNKEINGFKNGINNWQNTIVVMFSEFGRVVKQNGSGTDHGHGNLMTIFGGLLTKSNVYGDWIDLKEKNLHQNRDLPVMYEYRDVLSVIFQKIYGLNNNQVEHIFPKHKKINFNIV